MNIQVEKEDISKIGYTGYKENGFLAIICNGDTANKTMTVKKYMISSSLQTCHMIYIWSVTINKLNYA